MRAHVAAERENGRKVGLYDLGPDVVGELVGRVAALDAAAVEQDVDLVAVGEDLGDEGFYRRLGG